MRFKGRSGFRVKASMVQVLTKYPGGNSIHKCKAVLSMATYTFKQMGQEFCGTLSLTKAGCCGMRRKYFLGLLKGPGKGGAVVNTLSKAGHRQEGSLHYRHVEFLSTLSPQNPCIAIVQTTPKRQTPNMVLNPLYSSLQGPQLPANECEPPQ